ncbi:hypothetical protein L226DRAFT_54711 [Lentinus tigrinus ALCF2SS1-7]|uniref:uncharacterized protein n=1 Tax=Lentinus tigrinus ALCF2SS1-7 TaxID=1328758 RepID=UPI0011662162|nr:hypothetical protein L226DRAFT_54711 [Lentinus tigrinus ALCF2SS1-7]
MKYSLREAFRCLVSKELERPRRPRVPCLVFSVHHSQLLGGTQPHTIHAYFLLYFLLTTFRVAHLMLAVPDEPLARDI